MEYKSLGYLPRAPLVYSLAMVEYAPVPKMDEFADAIMEELRPTYPDIKSYTLSTFNVNVDTAGGISEADKVDVQQWRMTDQAGTTGLVFGKDRLIFHTTEYSHFKEFSQDFEKACSVLFSIASVSHYQKIGIRHIDNISPIDNLPLNDLVKNEYSPSNIGEDVNPIFSRVEHIYTTNLGQLNIRAFHLSNHPKVPNDLMPVADQLSAENRLLEPILDDFILADTDHIFISDKLLDIDIGEILGILDQLHEQCSLGFRHMVTQEAIDAWKSGDKE